MASVTIELDEETERRLRTIAEIEQRSTQEICLEAIGRLVQRAGRLNRECEQEPHHSLLRMIGLVEHGPSDSSVVHDGR